MMNQTGDYHFVGIHLGWWGLIIVIVAVLIGIFYNTRRAK